MGFQSRCAGLDPRLLSPNRPPTQGHSRRCFQRATSRSRSWAGPEDGRQGTSRSSRSPSLRGQRRKSRVKSRSFASHQSPPGLAGPAQLSLLTFFPLHVTPSAPGSSDLSQKPLLLLAPAQAACSHRNARSRADLRSCMEQPAAEPPTSLPHGPPALPSSRVPGDTRPGTPRPSEKFPTLSVPRFPHRSRGDDDEMVAASVCGGAGRKTRQR